MAAIGLIVSCDECNTKISIPLINAYERNFRELIDNHKSHTLTIELFKSDKIVDIRPSLSHIMNTKFFNNRKLIGAEIGTWKGHNALCFLMNVDIQKMYLIDPYKYYDGYDKSDYKDNELNPEVIYNNAVKLLDGYSDRIEFIIKKSEDAVNLIPNELDFVYIDGNHSYEYVKKDIELYWPKIRKGGILSGDDFGLHCSGVCKAVSEFVIDNDLDKSKRRCRTQFEDWWIVK